MPSPSATAGSTLTDQQEYYATRNWAWPTRTPTPWTRILACEDGEDHPIMEEWTRHWANWIERYRENGYHEVPLEIVLAVIMHESRGNPRAYSVCGAVGVMQVLPNEVMPGNPPRRKLAQSWFNIWFGLDLLESYEWEAFWYQYRVERKDLGLYEAPYREMKYVGRPGASELMWWYGDIGRVTLAMYQCGPAGFERGYCGMYGGLVYADDVLNCWVPWVQDVMGIDRLVTETPTPTDTPIPTSTAVPSATPTNQPRKATATYLPTTISDDMIEQERRNTTTTDLTLAFCLVATAIVLVLATALDLWRGAKGRKK